MANLFSDVLTVRNSNGGVSDPGTYLGKILISRGTVEILTNPADNDVFMITDLPSNAVLYGLEQYNTDLGADSINSVGMFAGETFTEANGNIINKNDPLAFNGFDAVSTSLNSANINTHQSLRFQANGAQASLGLANAQMWQLAALNEDPHINIRIGITVTTNWTTFVPGEITLICEFVCK